MYLSVRKGADSRGYDKTRALKQLTTSDNSPVYVNDHGRNNSRQSYIHSPVLFSEPPLRDPCEKGIDLENTPATERGYANSVNPYTSAYVPDCLHMSIPSFTEPQDTTDPDEVPPPAESHSLGCRGICGNCGAAVALWECNDKVAQHRETRSVQTSTEDLEESTKMSDRGDRRDRPVTRREFDDLEQNFGRKISESVSRIDEVMGWKAMIQSRVVKIEDAFMRSEALRFAQQTEVCERLELMRLWEVEKATQNGSSVNNHSVRPDQRPARENSAHLLRAPPLAPSVGAQRPAIPPTVHEPITRNTSKDRAPNVTSTKHPVKAPDFQYASIWDVDPDTPLTQSTAHDKTRATTKPKPDIGNVPVVRHKVDHASAMAGAKKLARQGTLAPLPVTRPQRTQGIAHFTPRPDNTRKKQPRDKDVHARNDNDDTQGAIPRTSTGQRMPPASMPPKSGGFRGDDKPQRHQVAFQNGNRPRDRSDNRDANLIDLSGMSSSWYDEESDVDEERGAVGGAPAAKSSNGRPTSAPTTKRYMQAENNGAPPMNRKIAANRQLPSTPESQNGECGSLEGVNDDVHDNGTTRSYADVAASPPWLTPQKKKRKRERSGLRPIPTLRGVPTASRREIYAQGLDYSMCTCHADFEEIVYVYCKSKGVLIVDACTIPKPKSRTEAGCKVTVKMSDYERVLDVSFWPEGTTVRDWVQRPRNNRRDADGNDAYE